MSHSRLAHRLTTGAVTAAMAVAAFAASPSTSAAGSAGSRTLTILQTASPVSLDPVDENDWNSRESIGYMYDLLIYEGPNASLEAGLATSWHASDHGLVWTFALRRGVKFQDGTPWNAQAAVKDVLVGWLWTPLELFAVSPSLHDHAFNEWMYLFLNRSSALGG